MNRHWLDALHDVFLLVALICFAIMVYAAFELESVDLAAYWAIPSGLAIFGVLLINAMESRKGS